MVSMREKPITRIQIMELAKDAHLLDPCWTDAHCHRREVDLSEFTSKLSELNGKATRIPTHSIDGYRNWIHIYNDDETAYLEFTLKIENGNRSNGAATPRDSRSPNDTAVVCGFYAASI